MKHSWIACVALALAAGAPTNAKDFLPVPPSVIREVEGKPAPGGQGAVAAQKTQERIAALKIKAASNNWDEALAAIRELKGMGAVARPATIEAVKHILSLDQAQMEKAMADLGDGKEAAQYEKEIDGLRAEARANVEKLDKSKPETVKKAHEYYDKLMPMTARMNEAWGLRQLIIESSARRAILLPIWREIVPSNDPSFPSASETRLKDKARAAVGDFIESSSQLTWGKPPSDPALKPLWFYGMSRKIEAYNKPLYETVLDKEEARNFEMVNAYREAIGLLPVEVDARLVQSARRHSKSMVDLKFFAHDGPVEGNKSPWDRMKNAGYSGGGGENIAYGGIGGEGTFWMWFDSPGHHKNMAGNGFTALGVGRWQSHFTQNFGGAPRAMLMTEEQRANIKIAGTVLQPDTGRSGRNNEIR